MPTASDFRNFAHACTRLAQSADNEASKTTFLGMAEKWSGLAVQAERIKQLVREADAVFAVANAPVAAAEKPKPARRSA
jgi:hypothetical protein